MNTHEKVLNTILSNMAPLRPIAKDGTVSFQLSIPGIVFEITGKFGEWDVDNNCAPFVIEEAKYNFPFAVFRGGEIEDETIYIVEGKQS